MTNDKQKDRLVELLDEFVAKSNNTTTSVLADHLLANGVIVPPCKVGDVVYTYDYFDCTYKLRESTVRAIKIQKNEMTNVQEFLIEYFYIENLFSWTNQGMFGKNVFLTKEEAEEALKGGVQG